MKYLKIVVCCLLISIITCTVASSAEFLTKSNSPHSNFAAYPTSGNSPLNVKFIDRSTGTPTSWEWNFGDGAYSTTKNPVHTYTKAGKYTVSLTVKNAKGSNKITKTNYINVITQIKPVAAFSAIPTSGKVPLKVRFMDKSTNSPKEWKWNFGDGAYSTFKNPVHMYTKAGNYTVSLTIKNAAGSNTTTKTNYINVTAQVKPVAAFSATPTSGNAPLKVKFTDKSTETPMAWKWNFGDGAYSTVKNPVHMYTKAGNYTVSLTIKNAAGSNTTTKTNYINVTAPLKPVAAFSATPTSGNVPLKVKFTDKSTGTPTSWKWNFGDRAYSMLKDPIHIYTKAGNYTVSLTVKNAAGSNTITKTNYINVTAPLKPVAAFSATPTSGKAPLKVQFTDKSTNNPISWEWRFGDGKYSTSRSPTHTYSKAGKYTVSLTVKNAKGSNTKTMRYIIAK